jgi:mono/diheme cytochrome c family protein
MTGLRLARATRSTPVLLCVLALLALATSSADQRAMTGDPPHVQAATPVEAGRYLAIVGGCNDCHTQGYLETEGAVDEKMWLAGSTIGWQGPWGTTYPANLRLAAQALSADSWAQVLQARKSLPPMPWMNTNRMSTEDARALHAFVRSLGPLGEPAPGAVPPEVEPPTPYISLVPIEPGAK